MAGWRNNGSRLRLADRLRRFARQRRGAAAIEFAFSGLTFLALVMFVIALGFRLYVQVALDYATSRAARLLSVDSTQSLSGSATAFQNVTVCPLVSPFLSCGNLTIALQAVTDFRNASTIDGTTPPPFTPGQGGSLMLLQISYKMPTLVWPLPTGGGGIGTFASRTVTAGYPYQNEY